MSIAEELSRIKNAKQAIKEAINSKAGSTVIESQLISDYADAINNLALSGNSEFGYIDEQGNFQPLDLSGDTPTDTGEAKTVSLKMFNTGVSAPVQPSGSSMDFYKCAAVYGPKDVDVITISGCPDAEGNGTYSPTEFTTDNSGESSPVYQNESGWYYYYNDGTAYWGISADYTGSHNYFGSVGSDWREPSWTIMDGMTASVSKVTVDVDVPKTWDGYKALFDGEYYSFSDALTTGMTYSDIVPKTGGIYTADLLVTVSYLHMETPPPVFAESFSGYLHNDFTQYATAPSFQTIEGRQCMVCDYSHRLSIIDSNLPSGNAPRTLTTWIHYTQSGGEWQFFCGYGGPDLETFYIATRYNKLMCYQAVEHPYDPWVELSEGWHHIALSFDGTKVIGYVDGTEVGYSTCSFDTDIVNYPLAVGYLGTMSSSYSTGGYISNLEVYDKALSAEEIVFIYQMQSI